MDSFLTLALIYIGALVLLPLVVGWGLDRRYGDPEKGFHPIVTFGKVIAWGEYRFNKGNHRKWKGALWAITLILGTFLLTATGLLVLFGITALVLAGMETIYLRFVPWGTPFNTGTAIFICLEVLVGSLLFIGLKSMGVFYCLAGKTLRKEVRMVFEACDRSLEEGRKQVGRIVGRDTSELSMQEVRTAALETLAENLSDGVVAPLFWFLILGLPGMFAYKMVNTLDSMIGYQNERYKDFGCWAAKIDDAANYIPARLTAFMMIAVSGRWGLLRFVKKFGRQHASPNSGYPESALAGLLDCRFGGPHNYFGEYFWKPYIGTNERPLTTGDMKYALRINSRVEVVMLLLVVALLLIVAVSYAAYPGDMARWLVQCILR